MANYHSIIHNYGKPQSTFNTELAVQALGYKQEKYDANAAKIDELISSYGNIELSRPEAKEYLYEKLNGLVNSIDGLQNADLSSRSVTSGILGHISQALDETVINEYQATQNEKDYYTQAQQAKKDGTYNDANFYQGYKKIAEWKNSELGTSLGKISYTPYKDVKADTMEKMEKIFKLKGIDRVWSETKNGIEYKVKGKVIEPGEITAMFESLLTPEDLNQLRIESEYLTSQTSEEDKKVKIEEYIENSDKLIAEEKQKRDVLKVKAKTLSGEEAKEKEAEIAILDNSIRRLQELKENANFDDVSYLMYYQKMKSNFVDIYKVSEITDFEANMDMLDFQNKILKNEKLSQEIQKNREEAEAERQFNVVASAGPQGDAAESYVDTTINGLDTATSNLVKSAEIDLQELDDKTFENTYGLDKETFKSKSEGEKKELLGVQVTNFIENGVDLTSKGASQRFIDAANEYRSSSQAFNVVYDEVSKGSEEVAKDLFEGMVKGVTDGSFNISNYGNIVIKGIIQKNLNKSYDELDSESKKMFEIASIDETITNDYVGDEATQKVLVKKREKLISEIKDPRYKNLFRSVKTLESGTISNTISSAWKLLTAPMYYFTEGSEGVKNRLDEGEEEFYEAHKRVGNVYVTDQNLSDLGSSGFITAPDFYKRDTNGNFIPANAGLHVKGKYENIVETVRDKAIETAPKLASTSTVVFNPAIKDEKDDANTLKSILASANGVNVDDMAKEIVEVTYNKENRSYTIQSNVKRGLIGAPDGPTRSVKVSTVVGEDMFPIRDLDKRTKRDTDSWALNAENPQSSNLKFTSGGFSTPAERTEFAELLLNQGKINREDYLGIMQTPQVLGLTTGEKSNLLKVERVDNGSTVSLPQEYPEAYSNLVNPATKITRQVVNRKGVYVTQYSINTPKGVITIPLVNQEATQLNYTDQYLKSFTEINEIYNYILRGYSTNEQEVLTLLEELNR